jgi:hypothetical protein
MKCFILVMGLLTQTACTVYPSEQVYVSSPYYYPNYYYVPRYTPPVVVVPSYRYERWHRY